IKNVNISVTDDGVGISGNDFNKLFKQFTRLPNEMSQRVGGTGVGLYLAKHLVALHHGSMRVRSAPGEGSTFTITLPIAPNAPKEERKI
ncbi:MAG TPA: ATP-binding protein, partial [Candidatus Saccharimonadales bacterium]|nr:ATP-binding protein [Candidatus Saccharimonadales bacterium]